MVWGWIYRWEKNTATNQGTVRQTRNQHQQEATATSKAGGASREGEQSPGAVTTWGSRILVGSSSWRRSRGRDWMFWRFWRHNSTQRRNGRGTWLFPLASSSRSPWPPMGRTSRNQLTLSCRGSHLHNRAGQRKGDGAGLPTPLGSRSCFSSAPLALILWAMIPLVYKSAFLNRLW